MREMTAAAARRSALWAQGFADAKPAGVPTRRHVRSVLDRLRLFQIDSVSVAARAHYVPLFSRIGAYDRGLLDSAAWSHSARTPRLLAEYWAHEAAFIPIEDWPLFRWRMHRYRHGRWAGEARVLDRNPTLAADVLDVIRGVGPCSARDVEKHLEVDRPDRKGPWWDRSDTKVVCEQLFASGALAVDKRVAFTRHYDLTERVIPEKILAQAFSEEESIRRLVGRSARALGVATESDLRDYYRLSPAQSKPAVDDLVEDGVLESVTVRGWDTPAFVHRDVRTPRRVEAAALLCPFDPLVFCRPRTERIFDFRYRLEIYTPAHKRVHGYYVFPFLLDGALVARVDLKADRPRKTLEVRSAFAETGARPAQVVEPLLSELRRMAEWLGLEHVMVDKRGDLAQLLAVAAKRPREV
ncbi:winged helix-turn-helix domain-containing protein [Rhodococcus tibetensis]|uniref:Winged helix DNA-binding domain-containing protein n=1 Tax=Rhodococcus tibetensis TaxID=2965064 RepID=A0ABT1QB09_9NOCA|nr:crosslink repair DNA glycosylase YcaQ family protein [Rhodococcus sp. FXJ9.536]MCQ4119402.1 winged helix DNA-binding domain-containing protein [Rhodococcus sp. FXJ9.536]